ncbi:MAG: (d)CMP kinase [Bacillota bacterium]|nr:(d)CMP kinase [Bacillota bacterium]
MIIAIDGPAGAGKSTIAKELSKKFDFTYISSGKIYRSIALYLHNNNIDKNDKNLIKKELDKINITYKNEFYLNGNPVENLINTDLISKNTSDISKYSFIRDFVQKIIEKISQDKNIIMDGRDIGTKVFPNAEYKFYLTATVDERAKRRFKELKEKGLEVKYVDIYESIKDRDYNDTNREIAPLEKADDAVVIDSSNKSIKEVVDDMSQHIDLGRGI